MLPLALLGMLGGLGSAAGGIAGLFGDKNKNNPANAANRYLDQIPGQMKPYYQPYMDAGKSALGNLQGQYGQLTNDPGALYEKLSAGYKPSAGYQFKLNQALGAGQNASASGGMLGTPKDVQQQEQIGHDISDQDFEEYLNHVLGMYGTGLQGQQGIENQGFDASTNYANSLGSTLGQKAQNAYAGQDWMNQKNKDNWSNIFGGLGAAGSGYLSGNLMDSMSKYYSGGA